VSSFLQETTPISRATIEVRCTRTKILKWEQIESAQARHQDSYASGLNAEGLRPLSHGGEV
jgi:hypothetical protein